VPTAAELKRIGHFGRKQHFGTGEFLARTGEGSPGMCVSLSGRIAIQPATEWMQKCGIGVDRTGFIRTGADVEAPCPERPSLAYETNVQGVVAVGDVRYGSVKRVGAAIGEGANVVAQIHGVLEAMNEITPPSAQDADTSPSESGPSHMA